MEVSPMGAQSRAAVPNMAGPHGSQITTTSVMEMSSTLTTSSSKKAKVEVKSSSVLFQEEDLLPHAQVLEFFDFW